MSLPEVVSRDEWLEARVALLAREKALTRERDALNADRRRLPMVEITENYEFAGPDGSASLLDLFDGRRQLVVRHFMFGPDWEKGCPSCTAAADEVSDGLLEHLAARETSFVTIARAPLAKIDAYRASRGWTFPFYSSFGSPFNYDFQVTVDGSVADPQYNYRPLEVGGASSEQPGTSFFLRDRDRVFHTYSTFGRGAEMMGGSYYILDLTPLGRQEEWEEPKGRAADARSAIPDFAP